MADFCATFINRTSVVAIPTTHLKVNNYKFKKYNISRI